MDPSQCGALFHLAIPVHELESARGFYGGVLGCEEGRSSDHWVDFDFHGHQLVVHVTETAQAREQDNPVDGKAVPIPHFGLILPMDEWKQLARRLQDAETEWVIEPYTRFEGEPGEQATMFLRDPSGNALEFKAFARWEQVFARD